MVLRIKQISTSFEIMNKRAAELGLDRIVVNAPAASLNASSDNDSIILDPIFIGRDDDVPILVEKLTQTCPQEQIFSILAIVGMGGMGKTTLMRKVFNHQKVKARFGSHIWIHVSQTFDPTSLFKKILLKSTPHTSDGDESREVILEKLQQALKAKTYLLVLDDVWNEDVPKWEDFMDSISGVTSTKGNAIIITTRSQQVASLVRPGHIHNLNGLLDEDCWSIIKAKTFDENGEVPSGFEMIGRKISKRCQGLPLAANVVGVVLRYKSEEEWRFIAENWLSDGEGGENIKKILKLSFDNLLSPSLKKCFAYCSIFPKGENIRKQEVIELWMAEGFLQPHQRNDMESVGNRFFNVLLQNSLLLVAKRDYYGNVWSCVMHDLVHDMACSVLGCSNNADGSTPVRYMIQDKPSHVPKQVAKHLHTIFLKGGITSNMLSDFKCLHVLTLRSDEVEELPYSIRKLIHLRNLNISNTSIEKLPEWIGELHHLQTLRVDTLYLRKLPSTLKYLINLRHLYINWKTELPAEIGRLVSLQTLRQFRVAYEKGYQIEELGNLKNLKGKLLISSLEKVHGKEEAEKANIFQKPNLFELWFKWGECREGERNDESVLEGLQPHPNLKELCIEGFKGKRFPSWTQKMAVWDGPQSSCVPLHNLIEITLLWCSECEEIPMLKHLPNLKSLNLIGLKKVRFINSSFNHLRSLEIRDLERLECLPNWLFYNNQNLSYLSIIECPMLRELPDGLDTLNSLKVLSICDCPNLRSMGNPSGGGGQSQEMLRSLCRELLIDSGWGKTPHLSIKVDGHSIESCSDSTDPPVTILPAVELPKENAASTYAENLGSEATSTSERRPGTEILIEESSDMLDRVIPVVSTADSNSSSISEHKIERKFADEIEEEATVLEDSETEISSGFDSQQRVESECHGEIQAETEPTSSNAERSKHHEEKASGTVLFQEKELYVLVLEDNHLLLKLDNHIILIGDYPSPLPSPPNSSPVNAMLNLVEQDLHELSPKPDYPNSLILFLQRNKRLTLIYPSFFDDMPDLRFLDLSDTKIRILPGSLFMLSKLKVLLLRNCISLEKLPPEIGELKKMEVLDLSGTELYDLPAEISQLELVRRMQLSFYGPDDESEYGHLPSRLVSPNFLSEIKGIQSLSISVHPEDHRWTEVVACIIKDISKLEMLSSLHFYFPQIETFENFIETSPSWNNQSLSKFHFTVGQDVKRIASRVPDEVESLFSQEERCLRYVNGDKASPLVKTVIFRATAFYLDHHTEVRSLSEFDISSFQSLKFCVVRECPKMQVILDEKNAGGAFPCLEYLGIYFIWELRQIWKPPSQARRLKRIFKMPIPLRNLEALKYLMIKTCPKLRFIFWESMLECLANLEELLVEDCEGVEKIIEEESKKVKYEGNVLPRLRKLVLRYLPELVSLGCGVHLSEEKISVYGCPKLNLA